MFFEAALKVKKIPRCVILSGPKGVGKLFSAKWLARKFNCLTKEDICSCFNCERFKNNTFSDVRVFFPDGKTFSMDQIREIIDEAKVLPRDVSRKILILPGIDYLRLDASNALLKVLEDSRHTSFILISESVGRVLPTILSRSSVFELNPLDFKTFYSYVLENYDYDFDLAKKVFNEVGGILGDFEQYRLGNFDLDLNHWKQVIKDMNSTNFELVYPYIKEVEKDPKKFLEGWLNAWTKLVINYEVDPYLVKDVYFFSKCCLSAAKSSTNKKILASTFIQGVFHLFTSSLGQRKKFLSVWGNGFS